MAPKPLVVFAGATLCFLTILTVADRRVFRTAIYEDGDSAANAILVRQAKHFRLLVGNYSRMEFNHPGPGLLYVLALSESVFCDGLHLVPAPANAHILGTAYLNAVLLGLTLAMLSCHWRSWPAVLVSLAVFLAFFAWHGALGSHWFPAVYFAIFLTFAVAAASVAAGRVGHLPVLGLAGSLAVHGHVCFVPFVLLITPAALLGALRPYRFQVRRLLAEHRRAFLGLALVVGLFVLPILLHTIRDYPGEIPKYLAYSRSNQAGGHSLGASLVFLARCLTNDAPHPRALSGVVVVAACLNLLWRGRGAGATMTWAVLGVCLLTTAAFLYYAWHGVDDLMFTYVGIFFGSVSLLVLTVTALMLAERLGPNAWAGRGMVLAAVVVSGYAVAVGRFANLYGGRPEMPAVIEALKRQPQWGTAPVLVSFNPQVWPVAAGFVVEMDRRGVPVYLADGCWSYLFSDRFTRLPADLWRRRPWHLDFAVPGEAAGRVLAEADRAVVQELDSHYRLGTELVFDGHERAFTLAGWTPGGADRQWTNGARAALALEMKPVAHPVALTVVAEGFVSGPHPRTAVDVVVNGEVVGHWTFQLGEGPGRRSALLPPEVVNRKAPLQITFEAPEACSPAELGLGKDPRRLAMNVQSLRLAEPPVP